MRTFFTHHPILKKVGIVLLCIIALLLLVAVLYVGYVFLSYSRIEDNLALDIENSENKQGVETGETYTIVTQNLGFGAYTPDFTFFMDGGTQSWAESPESVEKCITLGAETVSALDPDFVLFQEVDTDSTRSYHIDEGAMLRRLFSSYAAVSAVNYHSAYLFYPFTQPHGASNSSILTLSRYQVTSSLRRSLPISDSVSKLLDLDRCYSVSRIPVANGKELVLYNVHLSAYGGSDEIRTAQMTMLFTDMKAEYEAGNYCVCGGDFNHDFTGDSTQVLNDGLGTTDYGWAQPFPAELLPEGITRATCYDNGKTEPTCRNCDIPYEEGNFVIIVDGFLVSDNVEIVSLVNVQTGFAYSDHAPVYMQFKLK